MLALSPQQKNTSSFIDSTLNSGPHLSRLSGGGKQGVGVCPLSPEGLHNHSMSRASLKTQQGLKQSRPLENRATEAKLQL